MQPNITPKMIRETWQQFSKYQDTELIEIIRTFQKEQPSVLVYLLAAGGEPFVEDEQQLLLFYGTIIWSLMKQGGYAHKRVPVKLLDNLQESNVKLLTQAPADDQLLYAHALQFVMEYPEPDLLDTILNLLFHDKDAGDDTPHVRSANLGLAFMYLKTVMDAFVALEA